MNSKERVLMTINHEEPDKIPYDTWMAPSVGDAMVKLLNVDLAQDRFALGKRLGHDMLYASLGICDGFNSIYKEDRKIGENLYQDVWGIKWGKKSQQYGHYCEMIDHPLGDLAAYDKYRFPDPFIAEKAGFEMFEELIKNDGKEYAIMGGVPCTIFEAAWYLRGLENFLMDLHLNQDFALELLDKCMRYHLEISKKLVEMGVDIIWWGDDVANERGPYINPDHYRKLIKPLYAYMIQEVKKINKDVKIAYHCDGKIDWILDDFAELGIDILNPLQPDVNDVAEIKKKYGKQFTFWGNVDTRNIMSNGSCSEVVEEVKNVIATLAPGGGLILASNHTIQASARAVDNTIAFYWACEKYRDYPLRVAPVESKKKVDWVT